MIAPCMAAIGAARETVGARLRRLRLEQGFSQRDLSSPGITYAYISRIEAGARTPSVKALRMLAQKLGVTPGVPRDRLGARRRRAARAAARRAGAAAAARRRGRRRRACASCSRTPRRTPTSAAATRARIVLGLEAAARGDHAETIDAARRGRRLGARHAGVAAGRLLDPRPRLRRARARRGRRWRCSRARSSELDRAEPENLRARGSATAPT